MAFAITEEGAGSNSHRLSTTATRDGDAWVLQGSKTFISGVDEAGAILVVARTGVDEASGKGKLSIFIVDVDAPGLEARVIETEVVAPEKQYALFFDDVVVGADRLVGVEGEGLQQVFTGLNPERITGAAMLNGIGRYALDRATVYACEREVWDVPIGSHQGIAHPLAEAKINLELARLMTQRAAALYDGEPMRARRPTWRSSPPRKQRCAASTRPSRPTGAMAWPSSTASPACGAWPACSGSLPSAGR